jgi:hypothetical protein
MEDWGLYKYTISKYWGRQWESVGNVLDNKGEPNLRLARFSLKQKKLDKNAVILYQSEHYPEDHVQNNDLLHGSLIRSVDP